MSHDSTIFVSRDLIVHSFANRRHHSRASAEADDARGRTVSSKASSVDARAQRSVAWGERERGRERGDERTNDRSVDRSRSSIIGTVGAIGRAVRGGSSVRVNVGRVVALGASTRDVRAVWMRDGKTRRGVSDDDLGTDGDGGGATDRSRGGLVDASDVVGDVLCRRGGERGASSGSSASSDEDAFSTGTGGDGDGAERRRESERGTSGSTRGRMLWEDEWPSVESMSLINRAIFQAPPKSYDDKSHPWSPRTA